MGRAGIVSTMRILILLAAVAVAASSVACKPSTPDETGTSSGSVVSSVVSGTSFSRSGTRETHYAECTTTTGKQYRVKVPASVEHHLQNGQPCPRGSRQPMPQDKYPELFEELQKRLPYGGGDSNSSCGEWQTVDQAEARRWAKQCPPLKWGDFR